MTASRSTDGKSSHPAEAVAFGARYGPAAMAFHWTIAALLIFQVAWAWWVWTRLPDHAVARGEARAIHISVGLTILVLSLGRLALRLAHRPPPLPDDLAPWEQGAAKATHVAFYGLIVGLPLTGWLMVSMRPRPIVVWGLPWPRLPGLPTRGGAEFHLVGKALVGLHSDILVWLTVALLALHVAAALRHQFGASPILWRMVPFLRRG